MLGRIALGLVFICAVASQILNWDLAEQSFNANISHWIVYPGLPDQVQKIFNFILSYSSLMMVLGTIFTGLGGVMVLLGIKVRLGAILLILVLIPATVIMHAFWMFDGSQREMQMEMFLKNVSILGGLLILASNNSGASE